ncbi:MAG: hypothetical protein LKF96_01040 [Treponema sp.]|jgi:tetratricopeptide (TPR) repeat protein|nr:hypothetical protein [Treponema sp.]
MNCKKNCIIGGLLFLLYAAAAQTEGEKLFLQNKPQAAIPLLEKEISAPDANPAAYNYLGIAYYQTGDYVQSISVFEKGLNVPGTDKKVLAFNAGNSAFAAGDYKSANKYYSLAIAADALYTAPLLNRANSYLRMDNLENSVSDYERFLEIAPGDGQYEAVKKLVALLKSEIEKRKTQAEQAAAEAARLKAEQKRIAEETAAQEKEAAEQKAAEEAKQQQLAAQKAAAEAARRKKLLEDVASSLQDTESTNVSAGAEDIIEYNDEAELD